MKENLSLLIQQRDQESIILEIKKDPSILEQKAENGANVFTSLAYHGLSKAFDFAKGIKKNFTLFESIICGDLDRLKRCSQDDINSFSEDGFTAISLAAYFNQTEIAKHLLYLGADVDLPAKNPAKINALHAAVAKENIELVKLFLNHNADVNALQIGGVSPLHSAIKRGNIELVKLLVTYGADIYAKMENGDSPHKIANDQNHQKITEYLDTKSDQPTPKIIDKIAWIEIKDKELCSTRSKGKTAYYIPGGKRDPGESDHETLIREVKEELCVDILPTTIKYLGTYKAQADGHAAGIIVKMTCYTANYTGKLIAANEIEEVRWLTYDDYDKVSHVDKVIFDHLRYVGEI